MLSQPLYHLLTKEPKDLCFSADKDIALSTQYTVSCDML